MRFVVRSFATIVVAVLWSFGCNQQTPNAVPGNSSLANTSSYRLASEPAGALDVKAARTSAGDGEDVAVVGRIGGDEKPWVEGVAAFTIVDLSLKPCADGCATPWDYCCDLDKLPEAKAMVKVVDSEGKTAAADSRQLLGVKEMQTVVVHGKAKRDEVGNLTILADGVFVRP